MTALNAADCARCGAMVPALKLVIVAPGVRWCEHCATSNAWPAVPVVTQ